MRKLLPFLFVPVLAGCLSSRPVSTVNWLVVPVNGDFVAASEPSFGEARLAIISVRAPFDRKEIAVLRSDGSVAFDPVNQFAAAPNALLRGTALDVLRGTGLFRGVQPAVTTADVKTNLELIVDEFSLDCRNEGERKAVARVTLVMIENRQVLSAKRGVGEADAAEGNYSAAFGSAFAKAIASAAGQLRK